MMAKVNELSNLYTSSPYVDLGGAFYFNNFSKTIISNSSILYNMSFKGAGIYCYNSSPTISHNNISYNSTDMDGGGAIYCENGSNPVISNNIISYNSAIGPGAKSGGITCYDNPNISNNVITNNISELEGGGIYCEYSNSGIISHNIISYNTASLGGGIFCNFSNITISYNTISNNTSLRGGGIHCCNGTNSISDNIISNNTGSNYGGGICCENNNAAITNNSVVNNSTTIGGALYCGQASVPTFRNCIIFGNTASTGGAQVFLNDDGSDPNFYYCDVQGGSGAFEINGNFYTGTYQNNINADPQFVSPSAGSGSGFDGVSADWSLQNFSPCIDTGDPNGNYAATDFAGNPRVTVCRIDIGAYEYQTGTPLAVSIDVTQPLLCNGAATGELTAMVSGGASPYTYLWDNGETTANISGLVAGTYTVTVSETNGCMLTTSIIITEPPAILIDIGAHFLSIICGGTIQLDSVTSNYSGTLSYNWTPSTGLSYDTVPNPTATVTSNTTYHITITTANGCIAIDSVTVNVYPLIINGSDASPFCGDSATLFTSTNYTGTGELTYSWLPAEGMDSASIASPKVLTDSNQTYSVTVTTPNGCIATDDVNVSIMPMNAPEICIVSVDSINKNLVVWNKTVSSAIDTFYIFRETTTNNYIRIGAVPYDSLSVFVDSTSQPDVQSNKYKISIFDDCGLESDKSAYHKTMHLAINQGMGTWNLIWESYEGFTVTSYNIYRGTSPDTMLQIGTTSAGSTQYTDLTPPAGYVYYQVEVVSPNSCNPTKSYNSSRSNIASNNPDGIFENNNGSDLFSIYPNPVSNEITIELGNTAVESKYEIVNALSQVVFVSKINHKAVLDISSLQDGVYFVKVISDNKMAIKKFVKE
ncbi:MAG: right-handed parallel beta-helix repeat-containing protein [Bacteroidota bacterium]